MKVEFKLTADQVQRAKMVVRCFSAKAEEYKEDPDFRLCGNLNAQVEHPFGWNPNQWLELLGDRVSYRGERHPLCQDGGVLVLAYIAGYAGDVPAEEVLWSNSPAAHAAIRDKFERMEVVSYETSDRRLKWFETLSSYMETRANWDEVVEAVMAGKQKLNLEYIPDRFQDKERLIRGLLKKDRKVHYEFSLAEIKEARGLIRASELELY